MDEFIEVVESRIGFGGGRLGFQGGSGKEQGVDAQGAESV